MAMIPMFFRLATGRARVSKLCLMAGSMTIVPPPKALWPDFIPTRARIQGHLYTIEVMPLQRGFQRGRGLVTGDAEEPGHFLLSQLKKGIQDSVPASILVRSSSPEVDGLY